MSISPFSARPGSPATERRRARLVLVIASLGIAATLLAYAISPGVRHVVGHAAHSVKHAVGHVFEHHHKALPHGSRGLPRPPAPRGHASTRQPSPTAVRVHPPAAGGSGSPATSP